MNVSAERPFANVGPFRIALHPDLGATVAAKEWSELAARLDGTDVQMLQRGRNLTVRLSLGCREGGGLDVAVKRYGRQPAWKDRLARRQGSKAWRAFRAADYLHARGIGTPPPVAVLERWEGSRLAESLLVTAYVPGLRSFRRELTDLYAAHGPCEALMELLRTVAVAAAEMHDVGFLHRDLGNQNILLAPADAAGARRVLFIDLNRGRPRAAPLAHRERARDLSRIHLPSDFLRVFLEMYWRGAVPPADFLRWERRYRKWYGWHTATRRLRHPLRPRPGPCPEGAYPDARDYWIWDARSVQAVPALRARDRHRLRPRGRIGGVLSALAVGALPAWRRYRTLRAGAFGAPVEGIGERAAVAVTARPETLDREMSLLRELGTQRVLVRLYHHEDAKDRRAALDAVRRLHAAGFGVALALVQDRRAVRDPAAWDAFGRQVLRSTGALARWVEVGHAVNRVKWGVWGFEELAALNAPVADWSRAFPAVPFVGPAAIDFEPEFVLAALRALPRGVRYAALSQHLYLDRRGAPESRQGPFDAVRKLALLRAIAGDAATGGRGLIVSEFNWPILGTGVWSPVGSPYVSPGVRRNDPSVDERTAAVYALRYLLLGLCSGLADEMVFWRLAARGFGLVDDTDSAGWRRRPAFLALRAWHAHLNGARYLGLERRGAVHRLRFHDAGSHLLSVVWAWPPCLPEAVVALVGQGADTALRDSFGVALAAAAAPAAAARGEPIYIREVQAR